MQTHSKLRWTVKLLLAIALTWAMLSTAVAWWQTQEVRALQVRCP